MGEAKSTSGTRFNPPAPEADSPSGPLSPIRVFVGLVVLLIVAGTIIYVTKPEASVQNAEAGLPESNNFALTDAEAITRFKELRQLAVQAARTRDLALLSNIFTADGPTFSKAESSIDRLLADNIIDQTAVRTLTINVVTNSSSEITLTEASVLTPCFVNEKGVDLTKSKRPVRQSVRWSLRQRNGVWLIDDAVLITDKTLQPSMDRCGS